jgi:outer membrane cobalamin receptor
MMSRIVCLGVATVLATARATEAQVRAELRGHIADSRTARPIGDARIDVVGHAESARSASDGTFMIVGLEPRSYTIRVRAVGYIPRDADVELVNGRVTSLDLDLVPTSTTLSAVVVRASVDTPSLGVATFDRAAIEASGRRDVGELIASVPGVVVTQTGGPGSLAHASIRGSSSNEVLVVVDGVTLNSPVTGDADLSRLPLDGIERVVVRTGAQSARYGSRALAGMIEIESRRPAREVSMAARAGAWGEGSGSMTLGDARSIGAARASGSLTADYRTLRGDFDYAIPDVRGGGTARRINSDVTSRQVLGAVSFDDTTWGATARASVETLDRGLAGSIVQPSTTGREGQRRAGGGVEVAWRPRGAQWTFSGNVTNERTTYDDPAPPFGSTYHDTVGATGLVASSVLSTGSRSFSASLGGEARSTDVTSTMLTDAAPHWQRVTSAFGTLRMEHQLDSSTTRIAVDAAARLDNNSPDRATTFSPRATGTISRGRLVASVSIGNGYAPASLADQFFHEGVLVRPNPSLRAERTRNNIDARVTVRDLTLGPATFLAEAAAFRADVDGMILWLPDYRFVWSPSNNDVRRAGWELTARGTVIPGIGVQGTLNRTDVSYAGPVLAGQVAYRPRTTANVTTSFGPSRAHLDIATRYVGARRTVPGSELNSLDPYWLTDLRAGTSWAVSAWTLDATAGIENLLNRPAAMLVDYPFPYRSWTLGIRVRRSR